MLNSFEFQTFLPRYWNSIFVSECLVIECGNKWASKQNGLKPVHLISPPSRNKKTGEKVLHHSSWAAGSRDGTSLRTSRSSELAFIRNPKKRIHYYKPPETTKRKDRCSPPQKRHSFLFFLFGDRRYTDWTKWFFLWHLQYLGILTHFDCYLFQFWWNNQNFWLPKNSFRHIFTRFFFLIIVLLWEMFTQIETTRY